MAMASLRRSYDRDLNAELRFTNDEVIGGSPVSRRWQVKCRKWDPIRQEQRFAISAIREHRRDKRPSAVVGEERSRPEDPRNDQKAGRGPLWDLGEARF